MCPQDIDRLPDWKVQQHNWNSEGLRLETDPFVLAQWEYVSKAIAQEVLRVAPANAFLVDLGCGRGVAYEDLKSDLRYLGVEPSLSQLPFAAERGCLLVAGLAESIPLKAGIADLILLKSVLDQCFDPRQVLCECRRILRADGLVVCSLPNSKSWFKILLKGIATRVHARDRNHLWFFDKDSLGPIFEASGFTILETTSNSYLRVPRIVGSVLMSLFGRKGVQVICLAIDKVGAFLMPTRGAVLVTVARVKRTHDTDSPS